jgi:hypothetical protein
MQAKEWNAPIARHSAEDCRAIRTARFGETSLERQRRATHEMLVQWRMITSLFISVRVTGAKAERAPGFACVRNRARFALPRPSVVVLLQLPRPASKRFVQSAFLISVAMRKTLFIIPWSHTS